MPHYEIHHSCELKPAQYQRLTELLTNLHSTLFTTPTCFVNITFHCTNNCYGVDRLPTPSTGSDTQYMAVGGKRVWINYITGHLRQRPASPEHEAKLQALIKGITKAWNVSVRPALGFQGHHAKLKDKYVKRDETAFGEADPEAVARLDEPRALHNVFIMEDIVAGMEQGFMLPRAGQDGLWVEENLAEIKRRAEEGDEAMRNLLLEYKGGLGKGMPGESSKL